MSRDELLGMIAEFGDACARAAKGSGETAYISELNRKIRQEIDRLREAADVPLIVLGVLAEAARKRWPLDYHHYPPLTGYDLRMMFEEAVELVKT